MRQAASASPITVLPTRSLTDPTRLLRETGLGVDAIATRVGYTDVRALRRAFHRREGVAPSEFRKGVRKP
ncbi:helix-turn-helix domain-containing protein [Nocardia cyriacigeorgica]|uniref:helix-turn-helix domain-containing protein n=1 Tax=Nocardia cyriacigeorgica TaxID=135487 RepID=UPI002490AC8D|nr:helix-turn-helix domain-containing protein [Nocardia cyriacigeorgica]